MERTFSESKSAFSAHDSGRRPPFLGKALAAAAVPDAGKWGKVTEPAAVSERAPFPTAAGGAGRALRFLIRNGKRRGRDGG